MIIVNRHWNPLQLALLLSLVLFNSSAWGVDTRFLLDTKSLDQKTAKPEPPAEPVVNKQAAVQTQGGEKKNFSNRPVAKRQSSVRIKRRTVGQPLGRVQGEQLFLESVRRFWPQLVAAQLQHEPRIAIEEEDYSLSLDPEKFPTLAAADGGRIVIDAGGKIPPMVKSLLLNQDNNLRIVSDSTQNRHNFFRSLLSSARFYSVEEGFSIDFGRDPLLTVSADYRIEKSRESLLRQELTLLNVQDGVAPLPPALIDFLGNEGFQVLEPFADQQKSPARQGELVQILSKDSREIADSLLRAMEIPFEADRRIELFNPKESGIALAVRADRVFEKAGVKYVVSHFEGDPVRYTLTRLLETRNYRVISLTSKDDFARVAEKLMAKLRLPGRFGRHDLWPADEQPYSIRLSGLVIQKKSTGGKLVITDRELDPLIVDLVEGNGFRIVRF